MYTTSLFIFRRDVRLEDNTALLKALEESESVVPIFIFDPNQINPNKNHYFSERAFQFMVRSLEEVDTLLKEKGSSLYVFEGEPEHVVGELFQILKIDALYLNKDYTPFSRKRDKNIETSCLAHGVAFHRLDDAVLSPIETIKTNGDERYTVYTPFMKNASSHTVPEPRRNFYNNYYARPIHGSVSLAQYKKEISPSFLLGGREEALTMLHATSYLSEYKEKRNIPGIQNTSRLSAHHKFGTISIRETYHAVRAAKNYDPHFISELYWRDFYYYIAYHFPHVFGTSFLSWAEHISWENSTEHFEAWKAGKTGVPMVDAGMRELNETGWMHNRSRMIVASYLTKSLLIDWRWGERYFAQTLIDYDPAQNNGGWQWSASVGADPRPLRIFNPYTQAKNYDPDTRYIKKWIPELESVDARLLTDGKQRDFSQYAKYASPLVDQTESFHRAMRVYKEAKNKER